MTKKIIFALICIPLLASLSYGEYVTKWTNRYDSGGFDEAYGVAVDPAGNVVVTGRAYNDYCTIKYNSSGSVLWTKFYDGGNADHALGEAIDSSGNIYVTGRSYNGADWDYCTIKYNSSGNALWTNFYDSGNSWCNGVAVATNFNPDRVFVTGTDNSDHFTYAIPPQKPVNFSGTALSPNSIRWEWTDNSDDEFGFQIQDPAHTIKGSVGANITECLKSVRLTV